MAGLISTVCSTQARDGRPPKLSCLPSLPFNFLASLPAPCVLHVFAIGVTAADFCPKASPTAAADDDLDDFLNSLTDETGPPAAAGGGAAEGANDVNVEDLDKMLG